MQRKLFFVLNLLVLFILPVNSQWQQPLYDNGGSGHIGQYSLSDFNILTTDNFIIPQKASILFAHNYNSINTIFFDYNTWQNWGPNGFQGLWSYQSSDKYLTLGTYPFHYNSDNFLVAMDISNGHAKVLGPPSSKQP